MLVMFWKHIITDVEEMLDCFWLFVIIHFVSLVTHFGSFGRLFLSCASLCGGLCILVVVLCIIVVIWVYDGFFLHHCVGCVHHNHFGPLFMISVHLHDFFFLLVILVHHCRGFIYRCDHFVTL